MIEIFPYAVLIMFASLVGVFSVWRRAGRVVERHLSLLVSFSAGVFLVIAYQLGIEALEHSHTFRFGLFWIIIGVLTVWLLFKFLPSSHHHHDETLETHPHSRLDARRIMVSDALHNLGDGIFLAASFALSIFVHELVQEMSEFFVLRQAGYSAKSALVLNFAISATILPGALGGFFLLESFEILKVPLLGLASGAFLVVVFHDLIPNSIRASKHDSFYWRHLLLFLIGVVSMSIVNILTAH